ncbi:cytosolic carboxypeptidase 6 isoform X1 [Osmia bicornis bicornis]|uniref:cytosolic carboxypeptidase 6 isoform X1 n=1 Tax=Osmia bicornis bicornis TaxID=1437191 RepID=UPI0010F84133|nr:cytosolic carboxypeptidase 6 isoform X1 [Osmia bicornis bicornis]
MGEGRDPLEHTSLYQRADSEDSDTEGGLGNVNKMVMRPPGHSGKAKKGHICFDASFETGNLGRVDLISEFEYDLFIRPDTCNPRLRLWFNFTVDNVKAEQRVVFNIVNISRSANLFRHGMTPLVKSSSKPKWQRIPRDQVFYYKSAQHQNHYVLSFAFSFDREEDVYQFALSYPYSYSRYLAHLDNLCTRITCTKRETLATSVQKRKIELITISSNLDDTRDRSRRVVVVLARIHPGESPSSFVCQGLMDFLVSSHPIAQVLRNYVVFKVVPMLNPDGVFLGNYRSTAIGADLNRSWNKISDWIHPALVAIKPMLKNLDKSSRTPLDCVLDLHAHTNATGIFVYGNTYDDVYRYERHIVLPKLLAQHAEGYEMGHTMYNQDPHKAGTARRYLCSILKEHVNCYSIEVSMYGYNRKATTEIFPYTDEGYYRVGRSLARVFLEYYKLMGIIPAGLPDQPSAKRTRQSRPRYRVLREPRRKTCRTPAPMHLASIHEYFQEETELPVSGGCRSMSGTRMSQLGTGSGSGTGTGVGGCRNRSYRFRSPGAPIVRVQPLSRHPAEPRLTIIDFNQLTRGGLELATSKNRAKVARKAAKPRR